MVIDCSSVHYSLKLSIKDKGYAHTYFTVEVCCRQIGKMCDVSDTIHDIY